MTDTNVETNTNTSKRTRRSRKSYVGTDENGNEVSSRSWFPGASHLRFEFLSADGEKVENTLDWTPDDVESEDMKRAFMFHGASQKLGDTYASALKNEELDPHEEVAGLIEQINGGTWVERVGTGGVGGQPSLMAVAIANVLQANGKEVEMDSIRAKLKEEGAMKRAKANPLFNAEYEKLSLERKQKKVAELAAKAKEADPETALGDF